MAGKLKGGAGWAVVTGASSGFGRDIRRPAGTAGHAVGTRRPRPGAP